MFEFLKVNLKWFIILFLVLFLFFQIRGCREGKLNDEIGDLKVKVASGEMLLLEKDQKLEKMVKEHEAKINELNGMIDSSNTVISDLGEKVSDKDKELAEMRESWTSLSAECQTKLHSLDTKWSEKFDLAEQTIAEKDKVIFSLTEKYESENRLRLEITLDRQNWKTQYFEQKELNVGLEKKAQSEKRKSSLERIGNYVLGGIALYAIFK